VVVLSRDPQRAEQSLPGVEAHAWIPEAGPPPVAALQGIDAVFTRMLARVLHRPAVMPVPAVALRLALGEMSEILTASQRALPALALRTGYVFAHDELGRALDSLLVPTGKPGESQGPQGPSTGSLL
jgi:NAD dependent epimerase/dehydratase family enzyme